MAEVDRNEKPIFVLHNEHGAMCVSPAKYLYSIARAEGSTLEHEQLESDYYRRNMGKMIEKAGIVNYTFIGTEFREPEESLGGRRMIVYRFARPGHFLWTSKQRTIQ